MPQQQQQTIQSADKATKGEFRFVHDRMEIKSHRH